jgi:hypothetical protein
MPGEGQTREIVSLARADGSLLVIDRFAGTLADARMVAQLAPDEPAENAQIVAVLYLVDESRGRCRRLTEQDLEPAPACESPIPNGKTCSPPALLRDVEGHEYCIRQLVGSGSLSELRWTRSSQPAGQPFEVVSLRDVVGALEDYEPARTLTAAALALHRGCWGVSVCRLAAELDRLAVSPIVLNRALREAVQRALAHEQLSMSEIAIRCGRVKRDRRGNPSGETSWLARRIGQLPEGGADRPTPWVHSGVLALIARDGLHLAPNEVEL